MLSAIFRLRVNCYNQIYSVDFLHTSGAEPGNLLRVCRVQMGKNLLMKFVFTGFRQSGSIRQYAFNGIENDRTRTAFTVEADLTLLRKHAIAVQEVPLLCVRLLEQLDEAQSSRAVIFTEQEMLGYASGRVAAQEAARQRRKIHRPPNRVGQAWRAFNV